MLQNGTFALKLLPTDACPHLILITDGVIHLPSECSKYDDLIMLLNREGITISSALLNSEHSVASSIGYIPEFGIAFVLFKNNNKFNFS